MARERRLVFGEVAELYERSRPSYPGELITDLMDLAGLDEMRPALEIGAGTGKATVAFAERGIPVLGLEPSEAMARLARAKCAPYPHVRIEIGEFESWTPGPERFALVFAAQAWHWLDPAVRCRRAREAMVKGGVLSPFWNRPAWDGVEARDDLIEAYASAPHADLGGPMHPANTLGTAQGEDWEGEIAAADGLDDPQVREYPWTREYSESEYRDLLLTLSDVRMMDPRERDALLGAIGHVVASRGGRLGLSFVTRVYLARAV